jgi:Domain of unknown function (DUF4342)
MMAEKRMREVFASEFSHPRSSEWTNKLQSYYVLSGIAAGDQNMALQDFVEEVQVLGRDLVEKVRSLVHEGNVQRIIIKDVHGNTFMEIPVSVAAVGVILAPLLAAVGAISALVAKFNIVVERAEPRTPGTSTPPGA